MVESNKINLLDSLLKKYPTIKINNQNYAGNTPLHQAVLNKDIQCIRLLLAQPSISVSLKNYDNKTALDLAIEASNLTVAKEIVLHCSTHKPEKLVPANLDKLLRKAIIKLNGDLTNLIIDNYPLEGDTQTLMDILNDQTFVQYIHRYKKQPKITLGNLLKLDNLDEIYQKYSLEKLCAMASISNNSLDALKLYAMSEVRRYEKAQGADHYAHKIQTIKSAIIENNGQAIIEALQLHKTALHSYFWDADSFKSLPDPLKAILKKENNKYLWKPPSNPLSLAPPALKS
jgi:hypothetical protein